LLSLIDKKKYIMHTSVPLVYEYESSIREHIYWLDPKKASDYINYLCKVSRHQNIYYLWRPQLKDPKDEMVLDKIYSHKLNEVNESKRFIPMETLKERCKGAPGTRKFSEVLKRANGINIIAEVKKASPSAGIIKEDFNHVNIAMEYEASGASSISVLTDKEFFMGDLKYLTEIKKIINLPVLRKDFIIDQYQIYEARAAGADAVLLIARILSLEELETFLSLSHGLGMECLVEVHDNNELEMVLETEASIIGINNRNLDTFKTDLDTSLQLHSLIPEDKIKVSESGIKTRADVLRLEEAGIDAILIGETLMRSKDIRFKMKELFGGENITI